MAWSLHRILPNSFKSENFLTYHYKYLKCESTADGVSFEWFIVPSFVWSHPQTRKLQLDCKSTLLSLRVNCLSYFYSWGTMLLFLCFVTSWAVVVTSVQGIAFSRKKDVVWKFQCVVLFFVKLLFNLDVWLCTISAHFYCAACTLFQFQWNEYCY